MDLFFFLIIKYDLISVVIFNKCPFLSLCTSQLPEQDSGILWKTVSDGSVSVDRQQG